MTNVKEQKILKSLKDRGINDKYIEYIEFCFKERDRALRMSEKEITLSIFDNPLLIKIVFMSA